MQQKLFEHERQRYFTNYVCKQCVLDPDNIPKGVQARYWRRKLHPILETVTLTLLMCPVCKGQHYTSEFFK